jgi:hypothetical protein
MCHIGMWLNMSLRKWLQQAPGSVLVFCRLECHDCLVGNVGPVHEVL